MTTHVSSDRILRATSIYPLFADLSGLAGEPFSLLASKLALEARTRFEAGEYLSAIIAQTKVDVAAGVSVEQVCQLGRLTAAELLCMGYTDREAQDLVLRAFDSLAPKNRESMYPAREADPTPTFDSRLDALRSELFGADKAYPFVFGINGAELSDEMTLDDCRFYHPAAQSRFAVNHDGKNPEMFYGDDEESVHVEVRMSAPNAAVARRRARKKIEDVLDRLQNLHPVHRSPVSISLAFMRSDPSRSELVRLFEPHHFVSGVNLDRNVERQYHSFYASFRECVIRDLLEIIWSHAKRARDSHSRIEKFLSYWTILERICDEADVLRIQPPSKGSTLTDRMGNFLASPFLLRLPHTICSHLVSRIVFASRPPYRGPLPISRSRFRFRDGSLREQIMGGTSVDKIVQSFPMLKRSVCSGNVLRLIDCASEFFEFDRRTASVVERVRTNLTESLAVIYQIRNSIVHDAYVDDIIVIPALEQVEYLTNTWLDLLTSMALHHVYSDAASILLSQYFSAETLGTKLKEGRISCLEEWPINVKDAIVLHERSPQFNYNDPVVL